jgi:hypothetical protein
VKRRLTIPPLGKPAGLRPRPRCTIRCLAECAVLAGCLLVALGSGIALLRGGSGAEAGWMKDLRGPAIAALAVSLCGLMLMGWRIRRQMSVWFDGFGVHFRRRLEARVLPWRTITRVVPQRHWYGTTIRIDSQSARLTIVGGYYRSAESLLSFLESQVRFHARIEARMGRG